MKIQEEFDATRLKTSQYSYHSRKKWRWRNRFEFGCGERAVMRRIRNVWRSRAFLMVRRDAYCMYKKVEYIQGLYNTERDMRGWVDDGSTRSNLAQSIVQQ